MEYKKSAALCGADFRREILKLPKTEIHLHLEALATIDTIWKLMVKNNLVRSGLSSKEELAQKFNITTLDAFIDVFINVIQNSFKTEDDFRCLVEDAGNYLRQNGIVYAELFFAPTKFLKSGFDFRKITETLEEGAASIKAKYGVTIAFLIDVSRTFGEENAMRNLDLTLRHRTPAIIGIGLGGAEQAGPAKAFERVFARAADAGLRTVAHAGEDCGPESVWDALTVLKAERIGHGISAIQDEKLLDFLTEHQIPLEICPTSNLFTQGFRQKIEEHPVRAFFDKHLFVTINSDDPTLFSTTQTDEYMLLYNAGIFSRVEILSLIARNIEATFLSPGEKAALKQQVLSRL